jgi:hypothetical protein
MFSKAPRAPQRLEIVYSGERFTWREDESVAKNRQRYRRTLWAACMGSALALLVIGHGLGVAWLLRAAAGN